ncbi:MAG: hypothetical protein GX458_05535, partial [Phyllobacteriaceae bacterium]|nr:hypothetical protein [Phyllobacteriaceae bacterium]
VALAAPVDFALATRIDRLDLPGDRAATAVSARVSGDEAGARANEFAATFGAARLTGDLRARRIGAATAVAGRLGGTIEGFSTVAAAGRPVLRGRLSGELAFETQGRDAAALVAAATGSGRMRLDGGRLGAVGLAGLRAPRDGEGSAEAVIAAMAGAETALPPLDLPLLLEKGRLQVPPTSFDFGEGAARGRATGRAAGDLRADRLDGVVSLEPAGEDARARATAVSHALPSLDLALSGTFEEPRFGFDPAGLAAFLTLRHVEREIEAAETLRQDRIERRRFSTILDQIERRRRAREAPAAPASGATPSTLTPAVGASGLAPSTFVPSPLVPASGALLMPVPVPGAATSNVGGRPATGSP